MIFCINLQWIHKIAITYDSSKVSIMIARITDASS